MTGPSGAAPPGVDLERLRSYLDEHRPGMVEGQLTATHITGGRSNLTYVLADGRKDWILRRPPLGHVLATAHDMAREHRVITALGPSPVPVPRTYLLCTDESVIGAPFYLMERVAGTVFRSDAQAATLGPERSRAIVTHLAQVLADLHGLDPAEYGLADFGRPEGFLERQVRRWRTQLDASRSRDLDGIDELHHRLERAIPTTQRAAVVHGDYRLDNVIVNDSDRVAAVLDWEMSTLGDPLTDLGLLQVYWGGGAARALTPHERPKPLAPFEDMINEYAARSDLDLTTLPWYVAFAYFKLAVILEGIHYRFVTGQTVGAGFDTIGQAVKPLVDGGLSVIGKD
jgi:aminoglycoside phosphotransferase (APT) family kinase protein